MLSPLLYTILLWFDFETSYFAYVRHVGSVSETNDN